MCQRFDNLADVLEAHSGERHAIILHDFPDPDAIASAFAHQVIANAFKIESEILYDQRISHPENVALVRLLDLDLKTSEEVAEEEFDCAVFVDSQGTRSNVINELLEKRSVAVLLVVDHHERVENLKASYCDIREVGATATIYADYLRQGVLEMDPKKRQHVLMATALMHGLMTDTGQLLRATEQDFRAASYLSRFLDAELLARVMSQARSKRTMEIIQRALQNRVIVENHSISGVGYLPAEHRDAIPQAADFLLTEENVHTAIVYGIVVGDDGQEMVIGSLRTSKITIDPDTFIKEAFGSDALGRYYGGGKVSAGGFEIPVGFLSGERHPRFQDIKWELYDSQIKEKLFAAIGVPFEPQAE